MNPASPTTSTDAKATQSADALFDAVYTRLKAMAGRQLAHGPTEASLDTTALVHELYLRVSANHQVGTRHHGMEERSRRAVGGGQGRDVARMRRSG